jgi:hypothetical protein
MNYYASPKGSDRAKRFREAYGSANIGQNFMFEGQPYAGPEGLSPDQQVQQYVQPPPGGWTGGVDPNQFAAQDQMQGVSSRPGDMSGSTYQGKDSDYYAQNFFREIPGGLGPDSRNMGLMQSPNGDWVADPSTDPSGQSIPFDHPSIAGTKIPFREQSADQQAMALDRVGDPSSPRFGASNQMGVAEGYNHQMVNAPMGFGMSGPGQDTGQLPGLLADDMSGPKWTDGMKLRQKAERDRKRKLGLLGDASDTNQSTDKSGWEKDKKFSNTQNLLMELGMNMYKDDSDPFGGEW